MKQGPPLDTLTRHLADCPTVFLSEPRTSKGKGRVDVLAVVSDLMEGWGRPLQSNERKRLKLELRNRPRARMILLGSYLLSHPDLTSSARDQAAEWLSGFQELSALVQVENLVQEPDRREEFARLCLDALGLVPEGETQSQAADRLLTLSSVEREKLLEESRKAQAEARRIREELAKKKREQEAAPYWSRE